LFLKLDITLNSIDIKKQNIYKYITLCLTEKYIKAKTLTNTTLKEAPTFVFKDMLLSLKHTGSTSKVALYIKNRIENSTPNPITINIIVITKSIVKSLSSF